MFSVKFTLAVLAAVSASNALSIPHNHRSLSTLAARKEPPAGWWTEGLEDYDTYHTRYLAVSCHTQHDTQFFDDCCHPMLKTENLVDNRKAYCTPSESASSSASAAEPTSTVDTGDEGTDEPDNLVVDNGNKGNNNNNGGNNNNNDDEGDDDEEEWDCDDEDDGEWDEPASASVSASVDEPKPTSTKEAEPTSTKEAEPTTTKEADPEPTSESQPEPTSGGDNNGGNGAYPGQITWYEQGGVAGACGDMHSDSDYIAAISFGMYGNIGAKSGLCGQKLKITNPANKNSITVTIADACQSCEDTHIDLSTGAFNALADPNLGLVDVSIKWL